MEEYLRVEEAAAKLGVSKQTIYQWVKRGRLSAVTNDLGSVRISQSDVEKTKEKAQRMKREGIVASGVREEDGE